MRYKSSNHCDMCVFVVCVCVWRERANLIMAKVWLASRQKQAREPHAYFDGCPTRFAPVPPCPRRNSRALFGVLTPLWRRR